MTISTTHTSVNWQRRPGRPLSRSQEKEREIIRTCVKEAIINGKMSSDTELARLVGLGERTTRDIRLNAGLNRQHVAAWVKTREVSPVATTEREVVCWTPFAGLWLLAPLIVNSVLLPATRLLRWSAQTRVNATQWVLTVVMWAVLGFRRFFHLNDFRHQADIGLALFTGRLKLLSDSTVWQLVHTLKSKSAAEFYQQTAAKAVPLEAPSGDEWISTDEHVVGFFTKLKPRPFRKDRVPTRGRSYPAVRLYAPFHLWAGRFICLVVTKAGRALSQVLPDLIKEVRQVRTLAGHPHPRQVDLIIDRGGYKGSLFKELMEDDDIRFIAMTRATKNNVQQWNSVAEDKFIAYQPKGQNNPNLKIAETETVINGCQYPIRTVIIRNDTPGSRQRWRSLFTNVSPQEMLPAEVDATYRRRQDHESSFAELDHYLAGKYLPKPYQLIREPNEQGERRNTVATINSDETMTGLKFVSWLRHWTYNLVKDFGNLLGESCAKMEVGTLVRKYIARPGILALEGNEFWVTLAPFTGSQALIPWIEQLNKKHFAIPWLGHLVLRVEIAQLPVGLAARPNMVRRRIFANRESPMVL